MAVDKTIYAVGGTEYYINPNKSCDGDLWVNCYRFLRSVEVGPGGRSRGALSVAKGGGGVRWVW